MSLGIILTVAGGAAELIGIGIVVADIWRDRKLARQYIEGKPSLGMGFRRLRDPVMERLMGRDPKYRTQELERDVQRTTEEAERAARAPREAFVNLVRDLLEGGLARRGVGAGFFVVGVILNVVGNVVMAS